jgi:hypothetical protein
MRYYMRFWLKERQEQTNEQGDPNKQVLWSRYGTHPDFEAVIDLWFLFEYMPESDALKYGIAENGELSSRKAYSIKTKLDETDEMTKRRLIEQWLDQHIAAAV